MVKKELKELQWTRTKIPQKLLNAFMFYILFNFTIKRLNVHITRFEFDVYTNNTNSNKRNISLLYNL